MPQWGPLGTFREVTGRCFQEPPSWCSARKPETHGSEALFPATKLREDQHRQVKTCTAGLPLLSAELFTRQLPAGSCHHPHWIKAAGTGPRVLKGYLPMVFKDKKVETRGVALLARC